MERVADRRKIPGFRPFNLTLFILLASASCATSGSRQTAPDGPKSVTGAYVAVSESEWSQKLELNTDGTAALTNARWDAGDSQNAVTHSYSGRWTLDGDKITLLLLESKTNPDRIPHTEELRYVPELSLKEIGRTESLPGVLNVRSASEESPLWHATMWRENALKALQWP